MKSAKLKSFIGIDYGLSRIGVATGQVFSASASILSTIHNHNGLTNWAALDQIIDEWRPDALVLGLPLNPDGSCSEFALKVQRFAEELAQRYQLPIIFQDEQLSSRQAENILQQQRALGQNKRRIKKTDIDKLAAAIILQRYLDGL